MTAIVGIVSIRGLRIEVCRRNQVNKSKLVLYKPLCLYSHLKQPSISNRTKRFSYKGGCGMRGRGMHGVHISRCLKKSWLGLHINGFGLLVI